MGVGRLRGRDAIRKESCGSWAAKRLFAAPRASCARWLCRDRVAHVSIVTARVPGRLVRHRPGPPRRPRRAGSRSRADGCRGRRSGAPEVEASRASRCLLPANHGATSVPGGRWRRPNRPRTVAVWPSRLGRVSTLRWHGRDCRRLHTNCNRAGVNRMVAHVADRQRKRHADVIAAGSESGDADDRRAEVPHVPDSS
jgi:hypothetical protein